MYIITTRFSSRNAFLSNNTHVKLFLYCISSSLLYTHAYLDVLHSRPQPILAGRLSNKDVGPLFSLLLVVVVVQVQYTNEYDISRMHHLTHQRSNSGILFFPSGVLVDNWSRLLAYSHM